MKVPKADNVSILKGEIKKEVPHFLSRVDAKDLELSQVSLRMDDNLAETLKSIPLEWLKPLEPLSNLFLGVDEKLVHVVVQAPSESFQSFSLLKDLIRYLQKIRMQRTKRREIKSALCTKVRVFKFFFSLRSLINIRRVSECHLAYLECGSSR